MNIPYRIINLLEKLNAKTLEKKVKWQVSNRATEYTVSFSGGGFVTIDSWVNDGHLLVDFAVFNSDGVSVDRVAFDRSFEEQEYDYLSNVYSNIVSMHLKKDDTYKDIFEELDRI